MPVPITFGTNKGLEELMKSGLYGKDLSEVAERLICEGLEAKIKTGFIKRWWK